MGLQPHGRCHQHRQDEPRIRASQVLNPTHPRRLTQFNRVEQRPVQTQEHRNLNQHWQTTAQWIDFLFLVQSHHFLLHFHAVVAVFGFERSQTRCNRTHFGHGFVRRIGQWEQHGFHNDGEQDDRPAPVTHITMDPVQQFEQWRRENVQFTEVFAQFQIVSQRHDAVVFRWACEQSHRYGSGLTCCQIRQGHAHTG